MTTEYYIIKDRCRSGLLKYLEKAFSAIPEFANPEILDIGCGSGVPTLWLAGRYCGSITAIDTDAIALEWLQKKAETRNLSHRLTTMNTSFFNFITETKNFDIILAEGFLNVVGFETGFPEIIKMLNRNGYLIIHDEFRDHEKKLEFILNKNCRIIDSLYLDENIWWNDYYKWLETEIASKDNSRILNLFKSDIKEIEYYKTSPSAFRSIYYIIKRK